MTLFHNRYEQQQLLGRGAFSEVWKVYDTKTKVVEALKIYNSAANGDEDGSEMLAHEFGLMVNANHKNLLKPLFFDVCDNKPYLVLPYCEKGNINKLVGKMDEESAWRLLHDMSSALAFLHSMNPPILHQDIKPANILLNEKGDFMLTDFGVSTSVKEATLSRVSNEELALYTAGTIAYMAPERFSKNKLPIAANDIYSLGATVYEMLSGDLPFGNDGGLLQMRGAEVPELPPMFSPMLIHTLAACLNADPYRRPTAAKLEELTTDALRFPEVRAQIPIFETQMPTTMQPQVNNWNNTQPMSGYNQQMSGYNQHQMSGYNQQMSGYNQQMSGYNQHQMSGYNQQMSGYNQQTSGYNQQATNGYAPQMSGYNQQAANGYAPQLSGYNQPAAGGATIAGKAERAKSKTPIYILVACLAVIVLAAASYFMFFNGDKKEIPAVLDESKEVRFERAKSLILNSVGSQVTQGRDSLVKLSDEGYSPATFLYSRLIFDNQDTQYGLDKAEWRKMKKKLDGYMAIDNRRAHELLELAVRQDAKGDNWEALAELGYDYYKGRERCGEYWEMFLHKGASDNPNNDANLKKALEYFTRAGAHPDSDRSKTLNEASNIQVQMNAYRR